MAGDIGFYFYGGIIGSGFELTGPGFSPTLTVYSSPGPADFSSLTKVTEGSSAPFVTNDVNFHVDPALTYYFQVDGPAGPRGISGSAKSISIPAPTVTHVHDDFNGDGKSDILWHGADNEVAVWTMNADQITATTELSLNPGSHWAVAGTGDFDGDGKSDILWHGADNEVAVWRMDGDQAAATTELSLNPAPIGRSPAPAT